jgi:hypothetical protein
MPDDQRFKVYIGPQGDFLRTAAGNIQLFSDREEAQSAADEHGGFVLPADAASPGGFDRTWT